ncbi:MULTISPECIES: hypothetical protein [Desulfovibrio]|nr:MULTISPECIES: hypothetical protein [Desulfovibrio]
MAYPLLEHVTRERVPEKSMMTQIRNGGWLSLARQIGGILPAVS